MDCALHAFDGDAAVLAAIVAELHGSVVVLVEGPDTGAARRALDAVPAAPDRDLTLVRAHFDGRPIEDAAAFVFAVPGRCAVLAEWTGWDWRGVVTPGGIPGIAPAVAPVEPEPPRGSFGVGGRLGFPYLVPAPSFSVQLGPLYGEVSGSTLVLVTEIDARVGVVAPVGLGRLDPHRTRVWSAGVVVGGTALALQEGAVGTELLFLAEYAAPLGRTRTAFGRLEAGAGLWYDGFDLGVLPTVTLTAGLKLPVR